MTITITEKEYDAVSFAINQIQSEVEGANDEIFLDDAYRHQSALYSIMEKYKKARYKAREFQAVRAEVSRRNRNRGLRPRDIDVLTRRLLRQLKKND